MLAAPQYVSGSHFEKKDLKNGIFNMTHEFLTHHDKKRQQFRKPSQTTSVTQNTSISTQFSPRTVPYSRMILEIFMPFRKIAKSNY